MRRSSLAIVQGFEKFDVDVVNPSVQEAGRARWARSEGTHYELQGLASGGGDKEPGFAAELLSSHLAAKCSESLKSKMERDHLACNLTS